MADPAAGARAVNKTIAAARTDRRNEARTEKAKQKTPGNSSREKIPPDVKNNILGEWVSSLFHRSPPKTETASEPVGVKQTLNGKVIFDDIRISEVSEKVEPENFQPTIGEKPGSPKIIPTDLISENENIPITPIRETGELDDDFVEENEPQEWKELVKRTDFNDYILPESEFLTSQPSRIEQKDEELLSIAQELTDKTKEFNVTGRIMHICQGPVVTTYEFKPDPGVKYSRVTGLSDDLCLALKSESIRIERIPGKAFVGIPTSSSSSSTRAPPPSTSTGSRSRASTVSTGRPTPASTSRATRSLRANTWWSGRPPS